MTELDIAQSYKVLGYTRDQYVQDRLLFLTRGAYSASEDIVAGMIRAITNAADAMFRPR